MNHKAKIPTLYKNGTQYLNVLYGLFERNGWALPPRKETSFAVIRGECADFDWSGYGGRAIETGEYFVIVNASRLKKAFFVQDFCATIAHELLHVHQTYTIGYATHGNAFRKQCAKLSRQIAVPYYALHAYDRPRGLK